MDHAEFVEKWNAGKLALHVDKSLAVRAADMGLLSRGYRAAQILYTWFWIIGILAAIPLIIWYIWWVGVVVLLVSLALPAAIKRTAAEGMRDKLIEDKAFYDFAEEHGLFRVTEKSKSRHF